MGGEQLRACWQNPNEDPFVREESLWEYWRRVAEGALPFSRSELLKALPLDNTRLVDVLGLLARKNMLVDDLLQAAQGYCSKHSDSEWLLAQLNARSMLNRLATGEMPADDQTNEALVAKGTSWAAFEAIALLQESALAALLAATDSSRVFTKGQRHNLRLRAKSCRKKPDS